MLAPISKNAILCANPNLGLYDGCMMGHEIKFVRLLINVIYNIIKNWNFLLRIHNEA